MSMKNSFKKTFAVSLLSLGISSSIIPSAFCAPPKQGVAKINSETKSLVYHSGEFTKETYFKVLKINNVSVKSGWSHKTTLVGKNILHDGYCVKYTNNKGNSITFYFIPLLPSEEEYINFFQHPRTLDYDLVLLMNLFDHFIELCDLDKEIPPLHLEDVTDITVPYGFKSIPSCCFFLFGNLTSVNIPESVEEIGTESFFRCSRLISITIPSKVESLGGDTFGDCVSLSNVIIRGTIKHLDSKAFSNCTALTHIEYRNIIYNDFGEFKEAVFNQNNQNNQ